jgi:hypothetical protein
MRYDCLDAAALVANDAASLDMTLTVIAVVVANVDADARGSGGGHKRSASEHESDGCRGYDLDQDGMFSGGWM